MAQATNEQKKREIIAQVCATVREKSATDEPERLVEFTERFYGSSAYQDLAEREIVDLYGAVLSYWRFLYVRKSGETKVRVYNPDYQQHGWVSKHTLVEIITEDMPFLVDSAWMEINRRGLTVHFTIHLGGLCIDRNDDGEIDQVKSHIHSKVCYPEAPIYIEIDKRTDPEVLEDIRLGLLRVLGDVQSAVEDWRGMHERVQNALIEWSKIQVPVEDSEYQEAKDFLEWICNDHFTFLGCRDYEFSGEGDNKALHVVPDTGLGVLRDSSTSKVSRTLSEMTEEARELMLSNQLLIIAKTNTLSSVHRPVFTDYIGIKRFDDKGEVVGELRVVGLFTSVAYNSDPRFIPFLRRKVEIILRRSELPLRGHGAKALLNIIATYPRDDLFQASTDELYETLMDILHLQERQRIRLFAHKDVYGRFVSCLVYVPRERFNTELRQKMQQILLESFNGYDVSFSTYFSDSVLARIHFIVRIDPKQPLEYDLKSIETSLVDVSRSWVDDLKIEILSNFGEEHGAKLIQVYQSAFPAGYRESNSPRLAVKDIEQVNRLRSGDKLRLSFYRPLNAGGDCINLKLYRPETATPLSDILPMLEHMGLRAITETPYTIVCEDGFTACMNVFELVPTFQLTSDIEAIRDIFIEAFIKIWEGNAENDGFNTLVLDAQLNWREVAMLRAYAKYLRQIGFTFSQRYIEEVLENNPAIVKQLVALFKLRFDPSISHDNQDLYAKLIEQIEAGLEQVSNLDEDRILRRVLELIQATLRTNYYQYMDDGEYKPWISFKFDPAAVPDLPLPRPAFEIFVYSPRVEGVHLRSANVARGGLRWSDRREDFRTEILGLVKAQQVKNAVIVPQGAKGGFVCKRLPVDVSREELMEEVIGCYQTFIRGLLDLTDNLIDGEAVPPPAVVRYDSDDPYLVVAADKGTATFSDIANQVAADYGFWLGDAFASGGSAGYDHKKMGITARGAWESVKRHFRDLGHNTQTEDFTVIGIGDMSGDVFGNGMLLSRHIKLVGAFNHQHIFLDPNPDPESSYEERERLFKLPRSSWLDYDKSLISKGGGIYERSAKYIELTPEVKALLGTKKTKLAPYELISVMLMAPVDLIWNGGIGTYVKASSEQHGDVGDRANDALRIDAKQLRCKVVGEGGNLGFTQLARIEYALNDGHVYSDFVDNSAGVDCSDHEVNIKILLNDIVRNQDMTEKQRNQLLAEMTDEVAELVLKNNYNQTQAINMITSSSISNIELHARFIREMERVGRLDRTLEFIPDDEQIMERKARGLGLVAPEIATLVSYCKITIKAFLLQSNVPDDPYFNRALATAFPTVLCERFADPVSEHRLRREIIATQLSNEIVNEMGFTFAQRLYEETGASIASIMRSYEAVKRIFDIGSLWAEIQALDYKVDSEIQLELMSDLVRLLRRSTRWILNNKRRPINIDSMLEQYDRGVTELIKLYPRVVLGEGKEKYEKTLADYIDKGVPKKIAQRAVCTAMIFPALDLIQTVNKYGYTINELATVFYTLGEELELSWFRDQISAHPVENHWDALARSAFRDDIDNYQSRLSVSVLRQFPDRLTIEEKVNAWLAQHEDQVARWKYMVTELHAMNTFEFTMFSVAVRDLLELTQSTSYSHESEQSAVATPLMPKEQPKTKRGNGKLAVKSTVKKPAAAKSKRKTTSRKRKGDDGKHTGV